MTSPISVIVSFYVNKTNRPKFVGKKIYSRDPLAYDRATGGIAKFLLSTHLSSNDSIAGQLKFQSYDVIGGKMSMYLSRRSKFCIMALRREDGRNLDGLDLHSGPKCLPRVAC